MPAVYSLIHKITRMSALFSIFSPWETCVLNLIEVNHPSSVSFVCKSSQLCPVNNLYKLLKVPSQTIFELESNELPRFDETDIVFLVDNRLIMWSNETVLKYTKKGGTNFRLVVVANISENIEEDFKSMKDLFAAMWLSGIVRCAVLLVNDTSSRIYTYLPFKDSQSCEDTTPVLLGECTEVTEKVFDVTYKILNLNQCPIRVTYVDDRPFVSHPLSGRLSNLVKEVAFRMNASIRCIETDRPGSACGLGEQMGSRGMVMRRIAHMAVGSYNQRECSTLEHINLAFTQCLTWCTPVLSANTYIYSFIAGQLQPSVWGALLISIALVSVSVSLLCAASAERWTRSDTFNLVLKLYAQSRSVKPGTTPVRIVVGTWLWICLVMRAAYEGELKSQSAVQLDSHIIHSLDDLLDLQLCTTQSNLQLLRSASTPIEKQIYGKTFPCNASIYESIVAVAARKDRAVFANDIRCILTASDKSHNELHLYPGSGGCYKTTTISTIVTVPGSPFIQRWRMIQDWCTQSGLILKWFDIQPKREDLKSVRPYSITHLLPLLFVLGVGYLGGWLIFVCELTLHWRSRCQRKPEIKSPFLFVAVYYRGPTQVA